MIEEDLTGLEINFILYLVKTCNAQGETTGIYYSEIMEGINCCKASFYELRDSLTEKGYITWQKNHSADIDVQLMGNDFTDGMGTIIYENYLNTNIFILNDKSFYALRAGAKRLALELIKRAAAGQKDKLWFIPYNQYRKLSKKMNISVRMIKEYFGDLKRWIHTGHVVKDGKDYDVITILKKALKAPEYIVSRKGKHKSVQAYPEHYEHRHYIEAQCRRQHIRTNETNIVDTASLIQQYGKKAKEIGKNIYNMVLKAIEKLNSSELNAIGVHKVLRNLLVHNGAI
jgi:hypothetical protein